MDWIVQVDCPDDMENYLHRIGRTARYKSNGKSLLFLLPSETKFLEKIKDRKLEIDKLNVYIFLNIS